MSNNLVTTIVSGAGTTTLTLAASAGTSVAGATIRFDNAPNLLAAATASSQQTTYLPISSGSYVVNSVLDLSGLNFLNLLGGAGLVLNDTLILGGANWRGDTLPRSSSATQFQFESLPVVSCNATPCIHVTNGRQGHYEGFQLSGSGNNNITIF